MADYKEMYLKLLRATAKAIDILIEVQQECEELYISAEDPVLTILQREPEETTEG